LKKQPLVVQTLYAELMEQMLALEAQRSIGNLQGCFTSKKIKGEEFVYFQHSDPGGRKRQTYIGKKGPVIDRVVSRFISQRDAVKEDQDEILRMSAMLRSSGAMTTDASACRVLKAFAESGLFRMGAVLVGTYAFIVTGNLLGVKWGHSALRTQDVDIAGERRIDIAFPQLKADVPRVLEQLEMGFLPVPAFKAGEASTSFKVRGKSLRVDFLTSATRPRDRGPVPIPRFGVAAQPLMFLDFLMENTEYGVAIDGGSVLVQVPAPARLALHKLLVSGERGIAAHAKTEKDLLQSSQLILILAEERPGDLILAWEDAVSRGKGWRRRLDSAMAVLKKHNPEAHSLLSNTVSGSQDG